MAPLQRSDVLKIFGGLSGVMLFFAGARRFTAKADHGAIAKDRGTEFAAFQRSYIVVYVVVMLADWLQGTHMFTLYTEYAQTNPSVSVGTLFFTGFLAAGILGTFTGPLVDKYGRKRACLVYVALEVTINALEHVNRMSLLLLGRVLGGVSTSLLFSAFEAWYVTEHRRQGFPEAWLSHTFGLCAVWNGVTAVAAGVLAQLAADVAGDIGPFQLAIALTVLAGVLMIPWRENFNNGEAAPRSSEPAQPSSLGAAWSAVSSNRALIIVGTVYALFEGAMYTFVFNWVPACAGALGGFAQFAPVQGLLFACLMTAISIGGELFTLATRRVSVETIGVAVFAASSLCMATPVYCSLRGSGDTFTVLFTAFLGFEVCVGAFQPCIASLRSKYVPDALQSTVNNLFRCPLNMLVAAGTMLSDFFPLHIVFAICTAAHAAATLCQLRLAMATPKAKVASD